MPVTDILKKVKKLVENIPNSPGVYKMKDENEKIIYIGKAKDLKKRVTTYFSKATGQSVKQKKMVETIVDVDYIETETELEALILETNLIKEHRPKYNVLMKDDKNFVYIKVSVNEDYPRITTVRQREKDGALYFGPKTSAAAVEKTMNVVRKIFPTRTCNLEMKWIPTSELPISNEETVGTRLQVQKEKVQSKKNHQSKEKSKSNSFGASAISKTQSDSSIPLACPPDGQVRGLGGLNETGQVQIKNKNIPIPCLEFHIKRCNAPCTNEESKDAYNKTVKKVIMFLKGNYRDIIHQLKYQMFAEAKANNFEKAAKLRDQIKATENLFAKQKVSDPEFIERDVIGIHPDFDKTFINLFQFREGKLVGQEQFALNTPETTADAPLETFLKFYYSESTAIPSEILIRDMPDDKSNIEQWLTDRYHQIPGNEDMRKKVKLIDTKIGDKDKILKLSEKNAKSFAKQSRTKWMSDAAKTTQAAKDLADELGMDSNLKRIECYDISHMGGEHTTASMVVFTDGSPNKKLYRQFKLKSLEDGEIDDYASMKEILTRRLRRMAEFAVSDISEYTFRQPSKKQQEIIFQTLQEQQKDVDKLNWKLSVSATDADRYPIAFARLKEHKEGKYAEVSSYLLEPNEKARLILHELLHKLIEKTKLFHIYTIANKSLLENLESFGFTRLKKIPDFLNIEGNLCIGAEGNEVFPLIYKIDKKKKDKSDDSFSQVPNLIIVDGGKGQLSTVQKVMDQSGLGIPIIGLAKKEEEIFLPRTSLSSRTTVGSEEIPSVTDPPKHKSQECKNRQGSKPQTQAPGNTNGNFLRIILPKNSQSLYLVQRIRDEAHRFANELRKKLGKKSLTASAIDDIPGIGLIIKRRLLKEYGSVNKIKEASFENLEKTVGSYIAKMLKDKL